MEALVQMPLDRRGDRPSAAVSTEACDLFIILTQEWGITAVWDTAQLSPPPASHFFWEVWGGFWPFQTELRRRMWRNGGRLGSPRNSWRPEWEHLHLAQGKSLGCRGCLGQ